MRVEVGPLRSASALAWLDFADSVVERVERGDGPSGARVPTDALAGFNDYLRQWRKAAESGPVFQWSTDADPEVVEYLLNAWFRLAQVLIEAGATDPAFRSPPEGNEFYERLLDTLFEALAAEGRGRQEFADHLREFWPHREPGPDEG